RSGPMARIMAASSVTAGRGTESTWDFASGMSRSAANRQNCQRSHRMGQIANSEPSVKRLGRLRWRRRIILACLIVVPLCLAAPFAYLIRFSDQQLRQAILE